MSVYASFNKTTDKITFTYPLVTTSKIGIGTTNPITDLQIDATYSDDPASANVSGNVNINRLYSNGYLRPYASYNNATVGTITGGFGIVNYQTQLYDTHSAVTTGTAWKFTTPTGCAGYYQISAALHPNVAANINIFLNGTHELRFAQLVPAGGLITGTITMHLNEGDYIDIRSTTVSINTTIEVNWVTIACIELAPQ